MVRIAIKKPPIDTKNTVIFSRTALNPVDVRFSVLNIFIFIFLKSNFVKSKKSINLDTK